MDKKRRRAIRGGLFRAAFVAMCSYFVGGGVAIYLERFARDDGGIVLAVLVGVVVITVGVVAGIQMGIAEYRRLRDEEDG